MENNKQSSIDILMKSILESDVELYISMQESGEFEQIKAMHKKEIVDAYCKAGLDIAHNDSIKESGLAQEYYIEAYGGDDE